MENQPKTTKKGQNWAALGGKQEQRPNWTLPLRQWEELLRIGELKRGPVSLFFWGTHPRHQSRQQLILTKSTKLLARPSGTALLSPLGKRNEYPHRA